MPVYVFKVKGRKAPVEVAMTYAALKARTRKDGMTLLGKVNGKAVWGCRDFAAEHSSQKCGEYKGWPIRCWASGVNPKQVPEVRKLLKKSGVRPPEYDHYGRPLYENSRQRADVLRVMKLHDQDGGYKETH